MQFDFLSSVSLRATLRLTAVCGVVALSETAAALPVYSVSNLGGLPGRYYSVAAGINNAAQVVGTNGSATGFEAVLFDRGAVIQLASADSRGTEAYAISNTGEVVGYARNYLSGGQVPVRFSSGQGVDLLPAGSAFTNGVATAINSAGQAVGAVWTNAVIGDFRATMFSGGGMTVLEDNYSFAYDINDSGQIVGQNLYGAVMYRAGSIINLNPPDANLWGGVAISSNGQIAAGGYFPGPGGQLESHAARLTPGGSVVDLGTLGGSWSSPSGISASGLVTGMAQVLDDPLFASHGFLYADGVMHDLNTLLRDQLNGWVIFTTAGMNDFGDIAASAYSADGSQLSAFLLYNLSADRSGVLPEPQGVAFLGLAVLAFRRNRLSAAR
jgi:probable HAF family extracellular repeat protein